ncbi:MAG: hypothetical protein ACOC1X_04555 [Promethearchaeota archaeon]
MVISLIEFFLGILTILYVFFNVLLGKLFLEKCKQFKSWETIYLATSWICLALFWFPDILMFILKLFTIQISTGVFLVIITITSAMLLPVAGTLWITSLTNNMLSYKKFRLLVLSILLIINTTFLILLFLFLIGRPSLIAVISSSYLTNWALFVEFFFIYTIILISFSGIYFFYKYVDFKNSHSKFKTRLSITIFLSYCLLGIIDGVIIDQMGSLIIRIISFLVIIVLYLGILKPLYGQQNIIKSKEKEK